MTTHDALLAKLPQAARDALAAAIASRDANPADAARHAGAALTAVGMQPVPPGPPLFPRADSVNDVQRAALEYSARQELRVGGFACPVAPDTRRRWLGVDPPGVLETIEVNVDGRSEPLWRALQLARDVPTSVAIFDALSCEDALRAFHELVTVGAGYRIDVSHVFASGTLRLLRDLRDEARAWAIENADAYPTAAQWQASPLKVLIFLALVRARVPIEPKWDRLFPGGVRGVPKDVLLECMAAVPEGRRAAALGPHVRSMQWALDVVAAFPSADLARALLDAEEPRSPRWNHFVEALRTIGAQSPAVGRAVDEAVAAAPAAIELVVTRVAKPKTAKDLSALEREQLRVAGRGYDQKDLDADARLAKPKDKSDESSFHGFFELRNIADADGNALYDALLYMTDAGAIFRAGTTEIVASLSQGGVVLETNLKTKRDDALRGALQAAIGPKATIQRAPRYTAPKKKTPKKKTPRTPRR